MKIYGLFGTVKELSGKAKEIIAAVKEIIAVLPEFFAEVRLYFAKQGLCYRKQSLCFANISFTAANISFTAAKYYGEIAIISDASVGKPFVLVKSCVGSMLKRAGNLLVVRSPALCEGLVCRKVRSGS